MDQYFVFRHVKVGMTDRYKQVAMTAYYADAVAVTRNWHACYIAYKGDIIFKKNVEV